MKKVKVDYPGHFLHKKTADFGGYHDYKGVHLVVCVTEDTQVALPEERCSIFEVVK